MTNKTGLYCKVQLCRSGSVRGFHAPSLEQAVDHCEAEQTIQIRQCWQRRSGSTMLQGIIHRDIKSENILLKADGTIKLADFGLSINYLEERPVTRAGTLDMMAPEVIPFTNST